MNEKILGFLLKEYYKQQWPSRISAIFYVLFAVTVAIGPIQNYWFIGTPFLYAGVIVLQRRRPNLVVLRRFTNTETEKFFIKEVLMHVTNNARVVWLANWLPLPREVDFRRHTPFATYTHLVLVIYMCLWMMRTTPFTTVQLLAATAFVFIGSLFVIDASVGNSPYPAFVFYAVSWLLSTTCVGNNVSSILQIEQWQLTFPLFLTSLSFLVISLRHVISPKQTIDSLKRLKSLEKHPNGHMGLRSRLYSTGPALEDRIQVRNVAWEQVVSMFLQHTTYVIVDITGLTKKSGLEWEIEEVVKAPIRVMYICSKSDADRAKALLTLITGDPSPNVATYNEAGDWDDRYMKLHKSFLSFFAPEEVYVALQRKPLTEEDNDQDSS